MVREEVVLFAHAGGSGKTRLSTEIVERVIEYVEASYTKNISLRDVALAVGYSPAYLTHAFRQRTGIPVTAYIIQRRIRASQELLEQGNMPVADVCELVGFNDVCYFMRQFVRNVGITPARYRRMHARGAVVLRLTRA